MTEPVAYIVRNRRTTMETFHRDKFDGDVYENTPLYTAEQLHPRVKMTQAEFDEWKELYYHLVELTFTAYQMLNEILNSTHNSSGKLPQLSKRVYRENNFMSVSKKQTELTNLFINYSPDNPEETIEIVPDMKWFVRAKKQTSNGKYLYLENTISNHLAPEYHQIKLTYAQQFDTKEEAEKWTNPLTEAVQLPVEGE